MILDTAHSVIKQHWKNCFNHYDEKGCNLTVLNHDDIIDFKSVAYFPEYATNDRFLTNAMKIKQ